MPRCHFTAKFSGLATEPNSCKNGIENSKMEANTEYITRFFQVPDQSFFLFGPRETGKSTWIRKTVPGALIIDLSDLETRSTSYFTVNIRSVPSKSKTPPASGPGF
jgi:predicted AAA+ superfamily ATPase